MTHLPRPEAQLLPDAVVTINLSAISIPSCGREENVLCAWYGMNRMTIRRQYRMWMALSRVRQNYLPVDANPAAGRPSIAGVHC